MGSTLSSFYKQTVYKWLALGSQNAKQLSGLKPLSLSNNKNYSSNLFVFKCLFTITKENYYSLLWTKY